MDYAVESLEKASDIERNATLNKLLNMQWLKNTSHSANPEKIKAAVYKQVQGQDVNKEIEDQVSQLTENIKIHLAKREKRSSIQDTCEAHIPYDTMPEKDENIWNKDIITTDLFPNADKLAGQKNEEDVLSIVESIVTVKLEAEFCTNKENKDQSSASENNENVIQDAACTNLSDLQKIDGDAERLKLIKHSDEVNNNSKSVTPCMSKASDKQIPTCKITYTESMKAEAKDKDIKTSNATKMSIKAGSNTNLTKDNERFSTPNSDSKKAIANSPKSLSTIDKNGKDYCNNKHNAKNNTKKQEFVKQRSVLKSGIEKETKNVPVKQNCKIGYEATDTCQNKNSNKDKALQKQTPKQFASKSKGSESLRRNTPTPNSDDKNKERATPESLDLPLNESERKNEKSNERNFQGDQKANRGVDFRKNTTFVSQYKSSTFTKPTYNIPRTGQAPMYGRNALHAYNNPKFDRDRNGGFERKTMKKESSPPKTFEKSNTGTEELDTNLESCTKQRKEIIQPASVKSTCDVDALACDNKNDVNPVKMKTPLIQSKEDSNLNADYMEQGFAISEQYYEETNDVLEVDTDQQHKETNNEEMDPFEQSTDLATDNYAIDSQIEIHHDQYSLKLENVQHANDINQLENSQVIWTQPSDNAAHKDVTVMSLQQSIQNMHFNCQQTFTQAGDPTRQMSPWESNNTKFYDQQFSDGDTMRIPSTYNALPYEYNAQMSNDDNATATSTLETTMSNRGNSSLLYRYGSNVQQRPVMTSDFHSMSACQANQARWGPSIQDGFHVEHPYVVTQPTMMHVYNPAALGHDDFDNTHTMEYVTHPIIYTPSPYMQTWNSQLQYPLPVMYNSPCTNYTYSHNSQSNNFNNSMHDQHHKHNPYAQTGNYRDVYDTNTYTAQGRNTVDNGSRSNYYKKHQDNCRAVYDNPQYASVSYSRSQQGMNFMQPATGAIQHNASYCPSNQKYYNKHNSSNYAKYPRSQTQDFVCDDNCSEDIPPIISPKEFVTNDISLSNKTDQVATRVFKPEFKTRSNSGYRPSVSLQRYNSGFRRNTNFSQNTTFSQNTAFQDFRKEYTYPVSIGRGTYRNKKI